MPNFGDIFKWNGWDDWGETKAFTECVLLRDVGEFKVGHKFDHVLWNDEDLTLTFFDHDEDVMVKKMGID